MVRQKERQREPEEPHRPSNGSLEKTLHDHPIDSVLFFGG